MLNLDGILLWVIKTESYVQKNGFLPYLRFCSPCSSSDHFRSSNFQEKEQIGSIGTSCPLNNIKTLRVCGIFVRNTL